MIPRYFVLEAASAARLPAVIRAATRADYEKTVSDEWQTSWLSDFIQQDELEKYALEIAETKELVGLGAYRNMPEGVLVYVEYIESAPGSNPTIARSRRYARPRRHGEGLSRNRHRLVCELHRRVPRLYARDIGVAYLKFKKSGKEA